VSEAGHTQEETAVEIDVDAVVARPEEQYVDDHRQPPYPEGASPEGEGALLEEDLTAAVAPGQPIAATCRRTFTAVHHSPGTRALSEITHIVIHSTEGDTAAGGASWFANPASAGSGHLVLDDRECYRTLGDEMIPWGAPGTNKDGFHIEHAGHASWDRQTWMSHEQTLRRGAFKAALHAKKFNIPLRWLSADDLRHGRGGFVTHATVTSVFPGNQGHTDPGPGFPQDHYMDLVKQFAAEM
jgi:N-acetylmuramoyl-L-alanine amidase